MALNSLTGELLHATWKAVAEFGKLVEIGTADLVGAGTLELTPFLAGRSYSGVNLDAFISKKPAVIQRSVKAQPTFLR